ncbi:MAG: PEGA domain-containing protein [Pseudomonadota bacterium]
MSQKKFQQKELIEEVKIDIDQPHAARRFNEKHIKRIIFGFIVLLLILLFWFIVTAKTVIVEISPEPDEIDLADGSLSIRLQNRYLAQPGEYELIASKQGYYPLKEKVSIGMMPSYTFKRTLQKKPGLVSIKIDTPERAQVYIDNQYVGVAPMQDIALTPGSHSIELQSYRYQTLWSELQVEGAEVKQEFSFAMSPNWSVVTLDSQPSNAQIWLDGERYDNTPAELELNAGTHHLEVIHPDFSAHISDFVVLPNRDLDLGIIELDREPSYLIIKSQPSQSVVYVNDQRRGTTPLTISATPNIEYQLRFEKAGYRSLSRTTQVKTSESKTVSAALKPILSTVHLDISPITAEVVVDGVSQGSGNQTLSLTTAPHTIEVMESGYKTFVLNITPQAGQLVHEKISLQLREPVGNFPELISNSEDQQMRLITPGEFVMGASRREQGRRANEALHNVKLTRRFYVGVNEITNEEFARFDSKHNSGSFSGVNLSEPNTPVTNITWQQAAQYANWLSEKEDLPITYREKNGKLVADDRLLTGYRLITEAEWAWLARVQNDGSLLRYGWGNHYPPTSLNGNYADQSTGQIIGLVIENVEDGFTGPAPVRSFAANHHGLYDIDANVAEWVHDYYTIYSLPKSQVSVDPSGPKQGKHHVIRGASWLRGTISNTRLAYRDYRDKARIDVGFRIARYIDK